MKRMNMLVGTIAVTAILAAQSALAGIIEIHRADGYHSGNGGEFTVYGMGLESVYAGDATYFDGNRTGFQTFCMERFENALIYPSTPDADPLISYYAVQGGSGATLDLGAGNTGDPMSIGTAWLYREFSDGALDGYDYDASGDPSARALSAAALQEAFWWLEHELVSYSGSAGNFLNLARDEFGFADVEELRADNNGHNQQVAGVAMVNFTRNGFDRQSMLVRVPDGGLTLAMLGVGLLGCSAIRRRCRS